MAYDPGAIDAALSAAIGEDPVLIADLRLAFVEGAQRALAAMTAAASGTGDLDAWRAAAARLKGLAASFGAVRLMALADEAAPRFRDPAVLRKLTRVVGRL